MHAAGGMAVAVADCDYPSMTPMHSVCASSATPSEAAAAVFDGVIDRLIAQYVLSTVFTSVSYSE